MTEQQIDRDRLRENAAEGGAWGAVVLALLDQLDQAEAELDYWMTRAYEAEGKLWKAEARIRHLEATAQVLVKEVLDAENARDESRRGKVEAEARIKAVEDVLDAWDRSEHHDLLEVGIRRALDGA